MGLENPLHIAFLLIILLMVFGAKRLPEMGRSLGSGLRGFKDTLNGESGPSVELPHAAQSVSVPTEPAAPAPAAVAAAQAPMESTAPAAHVARVPAVPQA